MSEKARLLETTPPDGVSRTQNGSSHNGGHFSSAKNRNVKFVTQDDDDDDENEVEVMRSCALPMEKICYGLGHVYNDLCAAVWFSYTLFYFQIVLRMQSTTAGALIMIGT